MQKDPKHAKVDSCSKPALLTGRDIVLVLIAAVATAVSEKIVDFACNVLVVVLQSLV